MLHGAFLSLIGNPVKFRDGPTAVIADESRTKKSLPHGWEDAAGRKKRKSEDLPCNGRFSNGHGGFQDLADKKGRPGSIIIGLGLFFIEAPAEQQLFKGE